LRGPPVDWLEATGVLVLGLSPRFPTRFANACIAGSRSRSAAKIGVAIQIDEYVPVISPINKASDKSFKVPAPNKPAPTNKIEPTGSSATSELSFD
jgi:hypothetical protein